MKKLCLYFALIIVFVFSVATPCSAAEDPILQGLSEFKTGAPSLADTSDVEDNSLPRMIGGAIELFLAFLGIIALLLFLYAGFLWMTAGGDSGQIDKAKSYMKNAVVGLVIVLASYIITEFIVKQINTQLRAVQGPPAPPTE